jgi:predicted dehydrogenase
MTFFDASETSRRDFLKRAGSASLMAALSRTNLYAAYLPLDPDKKLRIGIVGGGFGAAFPWHEHPNCEVTAVADLRDDRRKGLSQRFKCSNTYGEFHAMLKDSKVDALAMFTGAPSHVPYCIDAMNAGRHVISAVPAAVSLEQCRDLVDAVKKTGMTYMNAETSCFHAATMAARRLREQGKFGRIYFSEGAYYHGGVSDLLSGNMSPSATEMFIYKGEHTWRYGFPPGYYITHASGPVVHVTGEKLTEVSAIGLKLDHPFYNKNDYDNPFVNETFFFKTSGGNASRISIHWWTTEPYREGADYYGTLASFFEPWMGHPPSVSYKQAETADVFTLEDYSSTLPPSLRSYADPTKGHGGAEAFIVNEFVSACIEKRKPVVDVFNAVAFAAPGICGQHSAKKDGEWVRVPDFGPIS